MFSSTTFSFAEFLLNLENSRVVHVDNITAETEIGKI